MKQKANSKDQGIVKLITGQESKGVVARKGNNRSNYNKALEIRLISKPTIEEKS